MAFADLCDRTTEVMQRREARHADHNANQITMHRMQQEMSNKFTRLEQISARHAQRAVDAEQQLVQAQREHAGLMMAMKAEIDDLRKQLRAAAEDKVLGNTLQHFARQRQL